MRALLILIVVVLLLALVGWIKFSNTPHESTITIDKEAVKQDTDQMVERGNELIDETRQAVGTGGEGTPQPVPPSDSTQPTTETPQPAPPPAGSGEPAAAPPGQPVR
jgi:hypothetical protein